MRKKRIFDNFPGIGMLQSNEREFEISPDILETKDVLAEEKEKPSFRLFYAGSVLLSFILILRLLNLQITHGIENRLSAETNRMRTRSVEPLRGVIFDAKGNALVRNVPSYSLQIIPVDLPRKNVEREREYKEIQRITKLAMEDIRIAEKVGLGSYNPVVVAENIERDQALIWEAKLTNLPGVLIAKSPRREYTNLAGMSLIDGYIGLVTADDLDNKTGYYSTSRIGKTGLEKQYETALRGMAGEEHVEVDAQGHIQRILSAKEAKPGTNLMLSLDGDLQAYTAKVLQEQMKKINRPKGTAIAMNPQTGEILAMVSTPYYDNNLFAKGIKSKDYSKLLADKDLPMVNRAIDGLYPSGSTIKPMVSAAALQAGVINENTSINTAPGYIQIGKWRFPDWKPHGWADVRQAIAESNDVFFYTVGGGWKNIQGLGIKRLSAWYRKFGFGKLTGIDLPSESEGLVPDNEWKKKTMKEQWYIGDTYHMSIGQGYFLTTPLQIINATSAIANGGELLQPHLASKLVDSKGTIVKKFGKKVVSSKFVSAHNIQVVREGMRKTVVSGSARQLSDLPVEAAAKTGTAQYGNGVNSHAWFTCFAPYNHPTIAIVVMIEGGGEGSRVSQPVAKKMLQYYFKK